MNNQEVQNSIYKTVMLDKLLYTIPKEVAERIDELIRNRYRILLTRGSKCTYIYFTDPNVAAYFKTRLVTANYNS